MVLIKPEARSFKPPLPPLIKGGSLTKKRHFPTRNRGGVGGVNSTSRFRSIVAIGIRKQGDKQDIYEITKKIVSELKNQDFEL